MESRVGEGKRRQIVRMGHLCKEVSDSWACETNSLPLELFPSTRPREGREGSAEPSQQLQPILSPCSQDTST
jgi:hypothetical protein